MGRVASLSLVSLVWEVVFMLTILARGYFVTVSDVCFYGVG